VSPRTLQLAIVRHEGSRGLQIWEKSLKSFKMCSEMVVLDTTNHCMVRFFAALVDAEFQHVQQFIIRPF
jgi:hypothetical protein